MSVRPRPEQDPVHGGRETPPRSVALPFVALSLLALLAGGCTQSSLIPGGPATMRLTSSGFTDGGALPAQYACGGSGVSPSLAWTNPPAHTASFAVTCIDPHNAGGLFAHWLVWDIPPSVSSIAEGSVPAGAQQGENDFGSTGYGPPCPRGPHTYVFTVYALDNTPDLPPGASMDDVFTAIRPHILAEGQITAMYGS